MYKSGIYQIGAGHKYNLLGFPVGFYTNRGLTDMAEFVSRPLLTVNEYMSGGNTNPLYNIGYGEEEKHIKKMEQLDKDLTKHEALHTKDVEQIKKIIKKNKPMLEGDFNENPMDEDEETHVKQMKKIATALLKHEGLDKKSKTQIKAILKKYKGLKYKPVVEGGKKKSNMKGKGFLSDMFGTIGSVLGTIGKPIFDNVPALKPFSGLLGDNSAYGLASKGLKSIGLGRGTGGRKLIRLDRPKPSNRDNLEKMPFVVDDIAGGKKKGGRKIITPDHPKYNEVVKGCGATPTYLDGTPILPRPPGIPPARKVKKRDIIY